MERTVGMFAQRIAALNDEPRHNSVEGRAVVESHLHQIDKVFNVARCRVWVEANLDLPEPRRDRHTGVLFLKLQCHGSECSKEAFLVTRTVFSAD